MLPPAPSSRFTRSLLWLGVVGLPATLLWDSSWESTVGIDEVWAAPHVANMVAALVAGGVAPALLMQSGGVRLGGWQAPLGAWLALWGGVAFATAFLFGMWWQAGYGLSAGVWHPPQMLRAVAYLAIALGAWLIAARESSALGSTLAAAALLALIGVGTIPQNVANRQHTAMFFQFVCGTYPLVLAAACVAGKGRFPATCAALVYTVLHAAAGWLLPLVPGAPEVAPIYHPRTTLLPPPFPLLLVAPALAMDLLLRVFPSASAARRAAEGGLAFFVVFVAVQWPFAGFLLSPAAEGWFFAGGGQHWPFFLKISPDARTAFWTQPHETFTLGRATVAAVLAIVATRLGIALGARLKRLHT